MRNSGGTTSGCGLFTDTPLRGGDMSTGTRQPFHWRPSLKLISVLAFFETPTPTQLHSLLDEEACGLFATLSFAPSTHNGGALKTNVVSRQCRLLAMSSPASS